MTITDEITLDFAVRRSQGFLYAKQGDDRSRVLHITLLDHGRPFPVEKDTEVVFRAIKPDGHLIYNPVEHNSDGTVTAVLTAQTLAAEGTVIADLRLTGPERKILASSVFMIQVEASPEYSGYASKNETLAFSKIIQKAENTAAQTALLATEAAQNVQQELQRAKDSGAFRGERGPKGDTPALDKTLKLSGFAADAQSVGQKLQALTDAVYPVGSVYISTVDQSPAFFFGGVWEKIQNSFLLASGKRAAGTTGGEEAHTLTPEEMPVHKHSFQILEGSDGTWINSRSGSLNQSGSSFSGPGLSAKIAREDVGGRLEIAESGGGQPHSNLPPYLVVHMWKRTA